MSEITDCWKPELESAHKEIDRLIAKLQAYESAKEPSKDDIKQPLIDERDFINICQTSIKPWDSNYAALWKQLYPILRPYLQSPPHDTETYRCGTCTGYGCPECGKTGRKPSRRKASISDAGIGKDDVEILMLLKKLYQHSPIFDNETPRGLDFGFIQSLYAVMDAAGFTEAGKKHFENELPENDGEVIKIRHCVIELFKYSHPFDQARAVIEKYKALAAMPRPATSQEILDSKLVAKLRAEIVELHHKKFAHLNNEECWIYQGDGTDYPESLICPVVISADKFRELLTKTATGWMPIESAPKDGTEIIIIYPNCGNVAQLVYFNTVHKYWCNKGKPELGLEHQGCLWQHKPVLPEPEGDV